MTETGPLVRVPGRARHERAHSHRHRLDLAVDVGDRRATAEAREGRFPKDTAWLVGDVLAPSPHRDPGGSGLRYGLMLRSTLTRSSARPSRQERMRRPGTNDSQRLRRDRDDSGDAWETIPCPREIPDETTGRLISDTEVA